MKWTWLSHLQSTHITSPPPQKGTCTACTCLDLAEHGQCVCVCVCVCVHVILHTHQIVHKTMQQ